MNGWVYEKENIMRRKFSIEFSIEFIIEFSIEFMFRTLTARLQTNCFVSYITRYSKRNNNCFKGISIGNKG